MIFRCFVLSICSLHAVLGQAGAVDSRGPGCYKLACPSGIPMCHSGEELGQGPED